MNVQGIDFIERVDPAYVRIGISGAYQQPWVNWEADIMSFEYYQLQHPDFLAEHGERTALMAIDSLDSDQRHIVIALPVAEITRSEIAKTAVMVRSYRAMAVGVRQWSG